MTQYKLTLFGSKQDIACILYSLPDECDDFRIEKVEPTAKKMMVALNEEMQELPNFKVQNNESVPLTSAIYEFLKKNGESSNSEISTSMAEMGYNKASVQSTLSALSKRGQVEKTGIGRWAANHNYSNGSA